MRDNKGEAVFKWEIISEGLQDVHFSNGIIVAEDAVMVSCFYAISEVRKVI